MKIKLCFISLIIWAVAATVAAQSPDNKIVISDLEGVDVSTNPLKLELGRAVKCINWDLSKSRGDLVKRDGFTEFQYGLSGTQINGWFSGLYAYNRTDGQKRLFAIFNPDSGEATWKSFPYALLAKTVVSDNNLIATGSYPWQYYGAVPKWTTYQNILVHANGLNRPLRYNGAETRSLTEVPPGYFDFAPMKDTGAGAAQTLDGEYYYFFELDEPTNSTNFIGPSWRIDVDNDWVVIYNPPHAGSTEDSTLPTSPGPDTIVVDVLRTRAGAAWLDSVFTIGAWTYLSNDANPYYIDSIPDESLGAGSHTYAGIMDTGLIPITQDTTVVADYRLGQMQWLGTRDSSLAWTGISKKLGTDDNIWKATQYYVSWYDSSTGAHSAPGTISRIPVARMANDTIYDSWIELALPPIDSSKSHLWRLLYRAREDTTKTTVTDTIFASNDYKATFTSIPGSGLPDFWYCYWSNGQIDPDHSMRYQKSDGSFWCRAAPWTSKDTVELEYQLGTFRLIDTIKNPTQTLYSDSLSWIDHLLKPAEPPLGGLLAQLENPVILNDRLYMSVAGGSRVHYSNTGAIGDFPVLNAFDVNEGDGDAITAMLEYEGLVIFKNNSLLWGQEIDFILHNVAKIQVFNRIGCVAPNSVIKLPGGGFAWLHTSGIYKFQSHIQSEFKESGGYLPPKISGPIQNHLDKYDIVHLRECHAWLTGDDRNLVFSFPTFDTSWVLSLETGQWGQWTGVVPQQTTRYDTTVNSRIRPSTQVLFSMYRITFPTGQLDNLEKDNLDTIFIFGGSKADNGDVVEAIWKSGIIGASTDQGKLTAFWLWKESDEADTALRVITHDIEGLAIDTATFTDLRTHVLKELIDAKEGHGFQIEIKTKADSIALQRIIFEYLYTGKSVDN